MCIFVAYYIAETNTINIFTNKTKTIMKYKRFCVNLGGKFLLHYLTNKLIINTLVN